MPKTLSRVKGFLSNLKNMLKLAWEMDPRLTVSYYSTAAIGALAPLASSITLKYLIDFLQKTQNLSPTIPLVLIFVLASRYLAILLEDMIKYGLNETYYDYLFRYNLQNEFNFRYFSKLPELDIAHLEDPEIQNLLTKTRWTVSWRPPDYLRMCRYFFESLVGYISAFIVLFPFGWWVPFLITLIALPRLALKMKYGSIEWSILSSHAPETRRLNYLNFLLSDRDGLKEMKIFQTSQIMLYRLKKIQDKLLSDFKKPLDRYLKVLLSPYVIEIALLFMISAFFLPKVLVGALTIGSFTLLINLVDQLNKSTNGLAGTFGEVYTNNLYVQDYLDVMNIPKIINEKENPVVFDRIKPPLIEFKNVSFGYSPGNLVLKDVSFNVGPGESVALVGVNGAGKSTIIKLLCRFYDVTEGEIMINGVNIKDLKISNWYSFLGTLFQDFVHYHFTVKENIMLGDESEGNLGRMKEAAKKAGADTFIEALPNKYDQVLGREFEGGEELSIGQWQKLSIARAFYHSPPVLILDEPTSAIDAESEYEIFNNLEKHYTNKTLIFVSHRFSTVRNANRILVIDDGKVIEEGTHEQLMKKVGRYSKMFKIQAEGYK